MAMHALRCLEAVLRKNFTLKARQWLAALLELLLPVALMFLMIWIRTKITTTHVPAKTYVDSPDNNPTYFPSNATDIASIPGLPPAFKAEIEALCKSSSTAMCPEIFEKNWGLQKEYFTGSALDGLLLVHMAATGQRLGIVGSRSLFDFVSSLPGYRNATKFFDSQASYEAYLGGHDYGYTAATPALFGAIEIRSAASCPRKELGLLEERNPEVCVSTCARGERWKASSTCVPSCGKDALLKLAEKAMPQANGCTGDWEVVIQLNMSSITTNLADVRGSTDINVKLIPEVNPLQKGLSWISSRVFWSGGYDSKLGLGLPTGGLLDLQALVNAWIFNSTGAYQLPTPEELPSCGCVDPQGETTDDLARCNSTQLLLVALRSLTPHWSTTGLGNAAGCLGRLSGLLPVSFREIPFPTIAYIDDPFATLVSAVFGLWFVLVYIWPVTRILKSLVEDKEARINEVMKMMGMPAEIITMGWYLTYGILWLIPAALMSGVCWDTVFQHSNKFLVFLFFWLFGVCVITSCSFMAVFFATAKMASVVGSLIFFLLYFPYLFIAMAGASVSARLRCIASLSPPVALSIGASLIAQLESAGQGLRFSTLNMSIDNSSMAQVLVMLAVDTVFYAVLAWYFDKVIVVDVGTSQPWYFPFTRQYWQPQAGVLTQSEIRELEQGFDDAQPPNRHEAVPASMSEHRSILVRNLCKSFKAADGKTIHAVRDVTLNLYNGQIFCLLGHNGAGKTTTINMLSGMLPVSSGDAIVYGKSVGREMSQIRQILGVCPQHDVIWSELTVREHLEFFAKAKGVSPDRIESEVNELIRDVSLEEKEHALAGTLSGGQKRRLSAAIALGGGSRVVFLDEPSSGVDPYSRRQLWDCLQQKKEGRTLILTTHFMDEAETLGDRIAIMAAGKVKCVGSALFLKSQYGVGYTLTIAKLPQPSAEQSRALEALIRERCSQAELLSDVGTELTYRMPFEESGNFPQLFESLERNPQRYGIELFGVSVTTLEEVFLKVGRDHTEADIAEDERLQQASFVRQISTERVRAISSLEQGSEDPAHSSTSQMAVPLTAERITPDSSVSFSRHVHALLVKRYHNARRDSRAWCCQLGIPLYFLLSALVTMRFAGIGSYEAAPLNVDDLPEPQRLVAGAGAGVSAAQVADFLQGASIDVEQVAAPLNATAFSDLLQRGYYRDNGTERWGALRLVNVPDWSQPNATKTVGAYTAAGFNQPGKVTGPTSLTVPVGTPWGQEASVPGGPSVPLGQLNNRLQVDLFWNSTVRDAIPMFYQQLHETVLRRALGAGVLQDSKIKVSNQPFPLTASQKDLTDTQTSVNFALGFAFIPASVGAFIVLERETGSKHLQVISGVNFVSYWTSSWIWDILNYLVVAVASILLIGLFGIDSLIGADTLPWTSICVLLYGMSCTSFTYMLSFMFTSHTMAQNMLLVICVFTGGILLIVTMVLAIIPSTKELAINTLVYIFRVLPNFALADSMTNLITRTNPTLWLQKGCPFTGCQPYDLVITGYDMLYMTIGGIVFFIATLLLELAFATPKVRAAFEFWHVDVSRDDTPLENAVELEKERVLSGAADGEMVVLKGLRKVFPSRRGARPKVAVEDLYFGIPEGECFGFLGLNGAGKTTTMKLLTGEELCTGGDATIGGFDIKTQQNQVRRLIGYCPQFDALIGTLTAREHLTLFARIKGFPEAELPVYVNSLLEQLTLQPYADKQAFSFSGGTRRKLSLGLSLVGNPRCVFLDEPTTGVDPESRRFMWKLISSTMIGRAVILTTHSMEECEALCNRIGIMVNGRLVCLGTASQLKATHGYGYQFEVTFSSTVQLSQAQEDLRSFLHKLFPDGLRDEQEGAGLRARARYRLPKGTKPISEIFKLVEASKEALGISEYSVSETTLEQLFIQFAKHQAHESEEPEPPVEDASETKKDSVSHNGEEAREIRATGSAAPC